MAGRTRSIRGWQDPTVARHRAAVLQDRRSAHQPPAVHDRCPGSHHDQHQYYPLRRVYPAQPGPPPAPIAAERTSQVTGFIIRACSDQSRLMESDPPARPVLPSTTSP
jgi:hypothetical protein